MELRICYEKDDIIDYHECRVTQVITSQTLSIKKVTTNELQTFNYKLWITPLLSTGYVFRGIIDSLICRGKVNDVGWKRLFFDVTKGMMRGEITYLINGFIINKLNK